MKKINLEIQALSPLAIGRKKPGGNITEAETFIPGSVIRGAVAGQILKESNKIIEEGDDFHKLFLNENSAIFQNAYPGNVKIKSEVRVIPATVLSSKDKPGFKSSKGNGVFDTLIDRFCAENYGHVYDPNCPVDGGRVDNFTGFYSQNPSIYSKNSANSRLLTRVGINRSRATSEENVLYSIKVLNESKQQIKEPEFVIYKSAILVPDDLVDSLHRFIDIHQNNFRLGGASSRGLGKVKITAKKQSEIQSNSDNRINQFNKKLRTRWNEWGNIFGKISEIPDNRIYFTIDLQADAILTENGRRTTVISKTMLQQFTGVNDSSLELHAAYSSYDYRSGWNTAWGLMKDVELVTNRGGVYLFSTDNKELWLKPWEDLEVYGIGDRTSEGFGQVQICNEFHLVLREEAV
ncbi:type III-D CRISPR-associated RAMP protein Csx10 [Dolichospermum heterosporum]|uniref:CRISPR-associated RAMP protein Csx10 n=1 Tax=Dolichospermum heterosporum TAC447 TaxID=747523 RepID=A0ABY5M1R8_9CYAN|nr:CRISPR-associated RAMP protein Csx10 [Dolichospermum heterosporum]UUO16830.1 CRISPR-associated RAMP protein Csx10 [Dolichospermum heterosporum TAC447]